MGSGITVAYAGVHQAYEIARTADACALLDEFFCSIADLPGKWGGRFGNLIGRDPLVSRRCPGISSSKVREIPFPLLTQKCASRIPYLCSKFSWQAANAWFDQFVSRRLSAVGSRVFIGTETCARDSFLAAGKCGMTKVLDCPQVHPTFLTDLLRRAASDLGIPEPAPFDPPWLAERKAEEFAMADYLLVISDVQRRSFEQAGTPVKKLVQIPLWADPELWFPERATDVPGTGALDILFVGSLDLRKGIPYLVKALRMFGPEVRLSLVSADAQRARGLVDESSSRTTYLGALSKAQLRKEYCRADVLVLPSLVDTFGFVAMEAMACGCPVIVTENCGVPVPELSWRVPIMNPEAIANRFNVYLKDRDQHARDRIKAAEFAALYTPAHYRAKLGHFLRTLLPN